jgi:hypothetical protein
MTSIIGSSAFPETAGVSNQESRRDASSRTRRPNHPIDLSLAAMMKSFSCNPLIFLVRKDTVA